MRKGLLLFSALLASLPAMASYDLNYDKDATIATSRGRHLDKLTLESPSQGTTSLDVTQGTDWLLYHDLSGTVLEAKVGEAVTLTPTWTGNYMHGYLYVDWDQDGAFDVTHELMAYSYLSGKNSDGKTAADGCGVTPPAFMIPGGVEGDYTARFVIDWDYTDPAGRATDTNKITDNGGAIVDFTLRVKAGDKAATQYALNFGADETRSNKSRSVGSVTITSGLHGEQALAVSQPEDNLIYHDLSKHCFVATPGEELTLTMGWTGSRWMHGYVYLDCDQNGVFDYELSDNNTPMRGSDVMAYTYYQGFNSNYQTCANGEQGVNPPSFAVPAWLKPGVYRMRVKVDWDSLDPAGSLAEGNTTSQQGGAIIDCSLFIPDVAHHVITVEGDHGMLCDAEGQDLNGTTAPATGVLAIYSKADQNYFFDGLTISAGYTLPDDTYSLVSPALNGAATTYTIFAFNSDAAIEVPATSLRGNATIDAQFLPLADAPLAEGDAYAYPTPEAKATTDGITGITINGKSLRVSATQTYHFLDQTLAVSLSGGTVTPGVAYSGNSKVELLVDWGQDGNFYAHPSALSTELMSETAADGSMAEFALPTGLKTGVYRARMQADDCIVDFLLAVRGDEANVKLMAMNGIILNQDGTPMGETAALDAALPVKCQPTLSGFSTRKLIVRHGQNLNGPEFVMGNRQWADDETTITATGNASVKAAWMDGDVTLYALYEEQDGSEWTKIWGDEFNDGKLDMSKRWNYQERYGATWNRLVATTSAQRKLVNIEADGCYNSYAIPMPDEFKEKDSQPMISGAIHSQNKFQLTYGKIEARIKTTPHRGNFPAFWMMPNDSEFGGWPRSGEIDIWEQIDATDRAHSTVHSAWTGWKNYCNFPTAPKQGSPQSTNNVWADATKWHVFAIEWDADEIRWYVDGTQTFSYKNQHYSEDGSEYYTENLCWPFCRNFYIILNQSVGNGSWAANCDSEFTYLTQFDYVRVYKKKGEKNYKSSLKDNGDDPDFYVPAKGEPESSIDEIRPDGQEGPATYYDINGRQVNGTQLLPGIYIERRGTEARKIIVR